MKMTMWSKFWKHCQSNSVLRIISQVNDCLARCRDILKYPVFCPCGVALGWPTRPCLPRTVPIFKSPIFWDPTLLSPRQTETVGHPCLPRTGKHFQQFPGTLLVSVTGLISWWRRVNEIYKIKEHENLLGKQVPGNQTSLPGTLSYHSKHFMHFCCWIALSVLKQWLPSAAVL